MGYEINVGINGAAGAIGRTLIRENAKREAAGDNKVKINIVAANDLSPPQSTALLLAHDSDYRKFPGEVSYGKDGIQINGEKLDYSSKRSPADLNWGDRGVDLVVEATGFFADDMANLEGHLQAGAKVVLISAPSKVAKKTVVYGVNHQILTAEDEVVSNASCTTNCLAPMAHVLYEMYGKHKGIMNTIHGYTSDQRILDLGHSDPARAYAAGVNMIPTTTGAAVAVGKVLPKLLGLYNGKSMRIPVPVGSFTDLTVDLDVEPSVEEVNAAMKRFADGELNGVLDYREGLDSLKLRDDEGNLCLEDIPTVLTMIIEDPTPSIFDPNLTMVIGNLVNIGSWYDNRTGFSNQLLNVIEDITIKRAA